MAATKARKQKARNNLDQTAAGYDGLVRPADPDAYPVNDPDEWAARRRPDGLLRDGKPVAAHPLPAEREKLNAWAKAASLYNWMLHWAARHGIPMDDAWDWIEWQAARTEGLLLVAAKWPHLYTPEVVPDDDPRPDPWEPATESDAAAYGLHVQRPRRRGADVPTVPGCRGVDYLGRPCHRLRVVGSAFCPSCQQVRELEGL